MLQSWQLLRAGPSALVDLLAALLAHADRDLLAVLLHDGVANAGGHLAAGANELHIGHMDGAGLLDAAAGLTLPTGLHMAGDHVAALDDDPLLGGERGQDLAFLASVLAGDDTDPIALLDVQSVHIFTSLQNFGRERNDLHIILLTQFPGHGPEDTPYTTAVIPFSKARFAITVPKNAAASTLFVFSNSAFTSFCKVEAATSVLPTVSSIICAYI